MSAKPQWYETTAKIYDEEGRSTVPRQVRSMLDLDAGDKVKYINADGVVVCKKVQE